jgi:hypothetical protein
MPPEYNPTNNDFCFDKVQLSFQAAERQVFPVGKTGNLIRGALGCAMREGSPADYEELFAPRQASGDGPSGFSSPPRSFVLRTHQLEGRTVEAGESFEVDLHLFRGIEAEPFVAAFEMLSFGRLAWITLERMSVSLDRRPRSIHSLNVRFVTPTELKIGGEVAAIPVFPALFARVRDRLRALSGHEFDLDFSGMAERASRIELVAHTLTRHRFVRTSRKTGQTHTLGGVTGEATYAGDLSEFAPLLEAAYWTGVGRQTVWGKGVIELG